MVSILLVIMVAVYWSVTSAVVLDSSSNKFINMLVYINDDVLEGDGTLLKNVKDHLTKASKSLWKATGNMKAEKGAVQFGTIFIRIPRTWQAPANPITWQQCNKADFYITTHRDNNNRTEPFTKQLGKCGEKAEYTKFSEKFFTTKSDKDLVSAGKRIMNEFVKLRYGVFSEKPYSNMLTAFNGVTFINSTCGSNISWTINRPPPLCSDRNKVCNYTIDRDQHHNYSVMFDTETPQSEYFCNDHDKPHNKWAQSLHNFKCNRQSVSTVILKHDDFKLNKISQRWENIDFTIIKGQPRKIALVIDVSGSMASIIDNMRTACAEFIRTIEESASVGIAIFSSDASIISYTQLMIPYNKQVLISLINNLRAAGWTNIPAGIAKGIEILGGDINTNDKIYGTILLLSDGGNNRESPYPYDFAIRQVVSKGIKVNAICYGVLGDAKLNRLVSDSGGEFHFAKTGETYSELMGKFAKKQSCEASESQIKMIEATTTMTFSGSLSETNLTYIDQFIGKDIEITITLTKDISRDTISILNPSGKAFLPIKTITQPSGTTLTFTITGKPEFGMYKLQIQSKINLRQKRSTNTISITYRVSATPASKTDRILYPSGQLSSSEIEILTDQSTIQATLDLTTCGIETTENVTVLLSMVTPSNMIKQMQMTDDGLGDDNIEDDKIFTKTLIAKDMTEVGFYNFLAYVDILNTDTKVIIKRTVELGSMRVKNKQSVPIVDKVPPAKIEDVNVVIVSSEKKEINIEILSTGNDGMIGNISDYEIKITFLNGEITMQRKAEASPKTKLTFSLNLSDKNVTNPFEVVIRGRDDNNNVGEWSLSKISNWNYATIARIFSVDDKVGKYATKTLLSILSTLASVALSLFTDSS